MLEYTKDLVIRNHIGIFCSYRISSLVEMNQNLKNEILTLLPLCDCPRIPQLSRASTFQMITKSYNTSEYKN
jgi:hypothetical protein